MNRSAADECVPSLFNPFVHSNQSAVVSKMNTDFVLEHTRLEKRTFQLDDSRSPIHTKSSVMPPSSPTMRLSFQTLTNFVPWLSRSPTNIRSPHPISPGGSVSLQSVLVSLGEGGFISREKQLLKLRSRMQMEDMERIKSCVHVQCSNCIGEVADI